MAKVARLAASPQRPWGDATMAGEWVFPRAGAPGRGEKPVGHGLVQRLGEGLRDPGGAQAQAPQGFPQRRVLGDGGLDHRCRLALQIPIGQGQQGFLTDDRLVCAHRFILMIWAPPAPGSSMALPMATRARKTRLVTVPRGRLRISAARL